MLSIVVQAGGESRRMGQDKGLIPFLGQPLIRRVIDRVAHLGNELLITTNHPEAYAFLELPLARDRLPGRGALGGLYTALAVARYPLVIVVACDMPFVNAQMLAHQCDLLHSNPYDAVIPKTGKGAESFHAVYRREECMQPVKEALDAGKWRVDAWFEHAQLHFLSKSEILKYDPQQLAFLNLNTPEELQQAEQLAREQPRL
jgi:molybdopterin-guanine dinucleotide biosynthesis protein A